MKKTIRDCTIDEILSSCKHHCNICPLQVTPLCKNAISADLILREIEVPEIKTVDTDQFKCPHCGHTEYRLIDTRYDYYTMKFRHIIICEHCQQMMIYEDLKKEEK